MKNIIGMPMKRRIKELLMLVCAFALVLNLTGCGQNAEESPVPADLPAQETSIPADETSNTASVEIPQDEESDKMVAVSVENLGRANPFLPSSEGGITATAAAIPKEKLKYDLVEPPTIGSEDTTAQKIITTKVSGIMYDKTNPSAILNIEGSDYLVRSGDVINGYKVLSISKSTVTVQMGSNVYKAGVGQLVTAGKEDITYNDVANLNKKFGGAKK